MERLIKTIARLVAAKRGATSIEYAMIACLVSLLLIAGARTIGVDLSSHYFQPVANNLT